MPGRPRLLHLAIEDAPSYLDDIDTTDTTHSHLPEHHDDYDWNACSEGGDVWSFAVAEGEAEVSEITTVPGDAVGRELLGMIPKAAKPEDEEAFLEQLVAERRVVIRLKVDRLYGTALDING